MGDARTGRNRVLVCGAIAMFGCLLTLLLICGGGVFYLCVPPSPQTVFERATGINWPATATIVSSGDNQGGILGDGEFYVVLDVDQSTIDSVLDSRPSTPLPDWRSGPVPTEIAFHCTFGNDVYAARGTDSGPRELPGDFLLEYPLDSPKILYSAQARWHEPDPWHNGTLLVVDPGNQRIWLSIWDN